MTMYTVLKSCTKFTCLCVYCLIIRNRCQSFDYFSHYSVIMKANACACMVLVYTSPVVIDTVCWQLLLTSLCHFTLFKNLVHSVCQYSIQFERCFVFFYRLLTCPLDWAWLINLRSTWWILSITRIKRSESLTIEIQLWKEESGNRVDVMYTVNIIVSLW